VLELAQDLKVPLLERLKFATITSSNLDEFFMVRVASLRDKILVGVDKPDPSGLTPREEMKRITQRAHQMMTDQYNCYHRSLVKSLKKEGIKFIEGKDLNKSQKKFVQNYYLQNVYPVLTALVVDRSRPFPLILNKSLNIALLIKNKEAELFATVQVPSVLPRLVEIRSASRSKTFIFLEDIIKLNLEKLFRGYQIIAAGNYRITRNADLDWDEEGAEDLLETIEQSLLQRKWGAVIRLEVEKGLAKPLLVSLKEELEVSSEEVYTIQGPIDLTFLASLSRLEGFEHLRYTPLEPQSVIPFLQEPDIFRAISDQDILLHHPYQSFDPVVQLVRTSAIDPNVLAIKQTLYRLSGNSPIIEALALAAENGKQVTVLVELKARFDEENNIHWAKRLEEADCHVIYGLIGLKTHCKVLLIVRQEEEGIKRYVHLSTGNYNDVTAKIYTDLGLFTTNPQFGADASALFNMLSGVSQPVDMYKFTIAPLGLRQRFRQLIEEEAENAKHGKKARIIAKVNSLVDQEIIMALYAASNCGVEIQLIVRGICCLRPGISGVSENITVRSIVGRFLEHSRIFYFLHDGKELIYLSSADWMARNLDRRVELLFPVEDLGRKQEVKNILDVGLQDTLKARVLNPDGFYVKVNKSGKKLVNSQEVLYELAIAHSEQNK
ncbi:MAG: RNA degradosome polyphosphate kinase, partial [Desulfitobacteriaceae bacterium]